MAEQLTLKGTPALNGQYREWRECCFLFSYPVSKGTEMKLSDPESKGLRQRVEKQLASMAIQPIATWVVPEDELGAATVYAATDAGLYVGKLGPKKDRDNDVALDSELTPWPDVSGVHVVWTGYTQASEGDILTVKIGEGHLSCAPRPIAKV
jgi:hypothetical protein